MKKKRGPPKPKFGVDNSKSAVSSGEEDDLDIQLESILDDEIDQYNSYKEKSQLEKAKGKSSGKKTKVDDDDDEEEVYGLDLSSDEQDNEEVEDEESEDEEDTGPGPGIPDSRAWGRKAKVFHDTDYVDKDFGGFEGSDGEMADQEEAEAREIQKRLVEEFDESDFLDLVPAVAVKSRPGKNKETLKMDFDNMSALEKRSVVERDCPEVVHLLKERKEKLQELKNLQNLLENETSPLLQDFYKTKSHAVLNYCINISYFLYLRATNPKSSKSHPVIKRILQFRRLLDELQVSASGKVKRPKSSSNFLAEQAITQQMDSDQSDEEETNADEATSSDKRAITNTIMKNKGLTPYRKKELKNPRVKHRNKYRKATVRRKGQVRKPRTESRRYDGELTGIKMNVTKSVKFK